MRQRKRMLSLFKVYIGIGVTAICFLAVTCYILAKGASALDWRMFVLGGSKSQTLVPAIINTVIIIGATLLIAMPVGIGSAIYITEYAPKDARMVRIIRLSVESLAGIPSIIYGLFGFMFCVLFLHWSWSLMAGIFTMSIMVLPTIMRQAEEALNAVPMSYREGSFALGAGKMRTIAKILIPSAAPGLLVSVVLSIGRVVGETAALILTAGTMMQMPKSLMSSGATLSVYMYTLTVEGSDFDLAYATAIVLMAVVFLMNIAAKLLSRKINRGDFSE